MNTSFNFEEIKYKNELVDTAIIQLKKDFVGIDEQIDEVMNNVRTWYLYPQLQTRPLIVSIFGLTGTGKTALVRKIAKYLNIEKDLVYFNFAEIGEMHSYEIESTIEEELDNECSNRMFVYDEFQYAATLDESGCEKDNKSGLKPFWELMDSGILHKREPFWRNREIFTVLNYLVKINMVHPIELVDGQWVNYEECLTQFNDYDINKFRQYLNFGELKGRGREKKSKQQPVALDMSCEEETTEENRYNYFIKDSMLESIVKLNDKVNNRISDSLEMFHELCSKSYDEIIEILSETYMAANKGYDLKFNDSIIFVIANLDEAYHMSFDVNPDMSPDQFHKITKKISIVDIKEALKKRFRNEQIARLGNIHIIYPSFSSETFRGLIDMSLNNYAKDVEKEIGLKLTFDKSIKKCIYDEAVFPTHGTRPVFSTVHEIIKSKLPEIVKRINEQNVGELIDYVNFSFKNKNTYVTGFHGNKEIIKISFKEKLRLKKLRESAKDEEQALCAVHESGHFVVYAALNDKMPEKLVSKTTETGTGGFLMEDIDKSKNIPSFIDVLNNIKVSLGGYCAEKIVFGEEHLTSGACNDLERATVLATRAIREWGFGNHPYVTTYLYQSPDPKTIGRLIRDESDNDPIKQLFNRAYEETLDLLNKAEWSNMLKESAKYLSVNSSMPKKKMKEIYNKVPLAVKNSHNDSFYRDTLSKFVEK